MVYGLTPRPLPEIEIFPCSIHYSDLQFYGLTPLTPKLKIFHFQLAFKVCNFTAYTLAKMKNLLFLGWTSNLPLDSFLVIHSYALGDVHVNHLLLVVFLQSFYLKF